MLGCKRKDARRTFKWFGRIFSVDGAVICECMTQNVSAAGVKLIVPEPIAVPSEFVLVLSKENRVRRNCKILWRSEKAVGARFLNAMELAERRVRPETVVVAT